MVQEHPLVKVKTAWNKLRNRHLHCCISRSNDHLSWEYEMARDGSNGVQIKRPHAAWPKCRPSPEQPLGVTDERQQAQHILHINTSRFERDRGLTFGCRCDNFLNGGRNKLDLLHDLPSIHIHSMYRCHMAPAMNTLAILHQGRLESTDQADQKNNHTLKRILHLLKHTNHDLRVENPC